MVKCYTKKKSDGGSYTTCIGFQAKSGKTKPKAKPKSKLKGKTITIKRKIKKKKVKPTAKGVMSIQKKIKGTKKLKNKSTIKPVISKSKAKPKPKAKAQKKLSAGKSVLFTQRGFMAMVGKAVITKTELKKRFFKWELKSLRTMMKIENSTSYRSGAGGGGAPHLRAGRELEEIISESKVIDKKISGEMGVRGHADAIRKSAEKMLKKVNKWLKAHNVAREK